MKLKTVLLTSENSLLGPDKHFLKEITSTVAYTPPKKDGKTLFYDFYAIVNLYNTLMLDSKIQVPERVLDNVRDMHSQVVMHVGDELVRYLMWATVLELQHFPGVARGMTYFQSELEKSKSSHPDGKLTLQDFDAARVKHIPKINFDLAIKLLIFKGVLSEEGMGFSNKVMADLNVPHPKKTITPSLKITGLPDPDPSDVNIQKQTDTPLRKAAVKPWKSPEGWDEPLPTIPDVGDEGEPIHPPPEQFIDPDAEDPDHWVNKWIKQQGLDESNIINESERLHPPSIRRVWNALQKAGMDFRDVQDAFNNVEWGGSYGGSRWGEAVRSALDLYWKIRFKPHDKDTIVAAVDHVYDLQHWTGMLLTKGKMDVPEPDLDRRAQTKHAIHFLPFVSPSVKKVLQMGIRYAPDTHEQSSIMKKTEEPGVQGTPEQEAVLNQIGFKWVSNHQAYHATMRWINKRGDEVTTYYYIFKVYADGTCSLNNNLKADFQKFDNLDSAFPALKNLDPPINKSISPSYPSVPPPKSQKDKYLETHEKIKLPPPHEEKLKEYQFGWRPSSQRYRAEAKDNNHFYLYAFDDGSFLYTQKNSDKAKILTSFPEALATIANLTLGKVNPLVPVDQPAIPTPPSVKGTVGTPQPAAGGFTKKKFGFSPNESAALQELIADNFKNLSYMQWEIEVRPDGRVDVQMNAHGSLTIMFTVSKAQPVGSFGKPFLLTHYHGVTGESSNFYFHDWEEFSNFIVENKEGLAEKDVLMPSDTLPPHTANAMEYNSPGPSHPIRLTKEDEYVVVASGFVPTKGGSFMFYLHSKTKDILRVFSNNTARIHFSTKGGAPVVNFKPIEKAISFIKSKYTTMTNVSPVSAKPTPKIPAGKTSSKLGKLLEPKVIKAGFVWDDSELIYKDKKHNSILNIFQDRTSQLFFADGDIKSFPDYPPLFDYLATKYAADVESKGSQKSIVKPEKLEEFQKLVDQYGFSYKGTGMPNTGEDWIYEDQDGNKISLSVHGTVKGTSSIGEVSFQWDTWDTGVFENWLEANFGAGPSSEPMATTTEDAPLDVDEHNWIVNKFHALNPYLIVSTNSIGGVKRTIVREGGETKLYIYKTGDKYILRHVMTSPKTEAFGLESFEALQSFIINNIKELLEPLPLDPAPDEESNDLTPLEKNWLKTVPKLSSQVLNAVPAIGKIQYFTTYNVEVFEVGKKGNGNYYVIQITNDGSEHHQEFLTFDETKNFVIDNIEKLSIGEKTSIQPDAPPPTLYAPSDVTKELNKAGFKYHGPTEDHNGDVFKHPVEAKVVYWDDGAVSYYSSDEHPESNTKTYGSYYDFKNAVLLNKAYVYYNALMGEQYTKHYYDDVAPDQMVYSIRLTEEDEKIVKRHGFEWVPTSKTHQPNRYQRGIIHAIFYNKSIMEEDKVAVDIFNSDESGPNKGKLGSFSTIPQAIGWIVKNFPQEGDDDYPGESPLGSPTVGDPSSGQVPPLTEEEHKWLTNFVPKIAPVTLINPDSHVVSYTINKSKYPLSIGKDINGYFILHPYSQDKNQPFSTTHELLRFDSFDAMTQFIVDNVPALIGTGKLSKDDESMSSVPPTTPSGETYKTVENMADAERIQINTHDELLLAGKGFFWEAGSYQYRDQLDNTLTVLSNGTSEFFNHGQFAVKTFKTVSDGLQWIVENGPDFDTYETSKKKIPSQDGFSNHNYDTTNDDKVQKVVELLPEEENILETVGFKITDEFGYPLYFHDDGGQVAFYNDDSAHFHKTNTLGMDQDVYFYKDGTVSDSNQSLKDAPIDAKKGGVKNAILNILEWYKSKTPEGSNEKLADEMVKYVKKDSSKGDSFSGQKIYAIKALRQFYSDKTGQTASLLHAKIAIENWEKFVNYVKKHGLLPKLWSTNQGEMGVWLDSPDEENEHDTTLAKETEEKLNSIGFEYKGNGPVDIFGSPVVVYENSDGDILDIQDNGEVSYYEKIGDDLGWKANWYSVAGAVEDIEKGKISHSPSIPFSDGSPEDKTLKNAYFTKNIAPNDVIIYDHHDGSSITVYPPNEDKNVAMQVIINPSSKGSKAIGSKAIAFNDTKKTIERVIQWVHETYPTTYNPADPSFWTKAAGPENPNLIEGEPIWKDLRDALEQYGFPIHPKPFSNINGKKGVEYHKLDTNEYVMYFPSGESTWQKIEQGKPEQQKYFDDPQELYGFLKGDPKYTGKGTSGKSKPPYPTSSKENYHFIGWNSDKYSHVKLKGKDHELMEEMGFELIYDASPVYEKGQMQVRFGSDDSAEIFIGDKIQTKITSKDGGILAALQKLWKDTWGEPTETGGLATDVTTERLKKLGYESYGKDKGNYIYAKWRQDPTHGKILYRIELNPSGTMKHSILMKDKKGKMSPMTEHEWDNIEQGIKQIELWEKEDKVEPEKSSAAQGEMPYSNFDYKGHFELANEPPEKSVWLTPMENDTMSKMGFFIHEVPDAGETMRRAYARGDERMIFLASGTVNYYPNEQGATHSFSSFKSAMLFLWGKSKKSSDEIPYSGTDYKEWYNKFWPDTPKNAAISLKPEDTMTMEKMGFHKIIMNTEEPAFKISYNGPNGQVMYFFASGLASYWKNGEGPKYFNSVKEAMQFLWDTHEKSPEQMELPGTKTKMPFSGYDYYSKGIDQGLSNKESMLLHAQDAKVLKSLGFNQQGTGHDKEFYQKGNEQIMFYGDGSAKYWDIGFGFEAEKPIHKFTNVRAAMQFLWDKHHGGGSPKKKMKESNFKSFMKEWLAV